MTQHILPSVEMEKLLALHAFTLLDGPETVFIEQHISQCPECNDKLASFRSIAAAIGAGASMTPPSSLRGRVLQMATRAAKSAHTDVQVWKNWDPTVSSTMHVVRDVEGEWQPVHTGIWAKQLYVDAKQGTTTMLIRMDPGSRYVPHRHAGAEQCYVLQGDLREGDFVIHAGDFQCMPPGTQHEAQSTESGCLLLIVSSMHDELLA